MMKKAGKVLEGMKYSGVTTLQSAGCHVPCFT